MQRALGSNSENPFKIDIPDFRQGKIVIPHVGASIIDTVKEDTTMDEASPVANASPAVIRSPEIWT